MEKFSLEELSGGQLLQCPVQNRAVLQVGMGSVGRTLPGCTGKVLGGGLSLCPAPHKEELLTPLQIC